MLLIRVILGPCGRRSTQFGPHGDIFRSKSTHLFFFSFFSDGCLRPLDPGILGPRFMGDCSSARGVAYQRTRHDLECESRHGIIFCISPKGAISGTTTQKGILFFCFWTVLGPAAIQLPGHRPSRASGDQPNCPPHINGEGHRCFLCSCMLAVSQFVSGLLSYIVHRLLAYQI